MGPQHARQPAKPAGDHKGDVFVQPDIVAEHRHARLTLTDSLEAASEWRSHQHIHQNHRYDEKAKDEKEERHFVCQIETEIRSRLNDDYAVATGQRIPTIGQAPDALAER